VGLDVVQGEGVHVISLFCPVCLVSDLPPGQTKWNLTWSDVRVFMLLPFFAQCVSPFISWTDKVGLDMVRCEGVHITSLFCPVCLVQIDNPVCFTYPLDGQSGT
jgi:hypothetical protein